MMIGNHLIKSWSSSQSVIALSSGEAELYAMTKAASQTIGLMSLAADFGEELAGEVRSDASAAIGIIHRKGLGKVRHIDVQDLWLQEKVARKELEVTKVPGAQNPADMMTKHITGEATKENLSRLGCMLAEGRAEKAPQLAQ